MLTKKQAEATVALEREIPSEAEAARLTAVLALLQDNAYEETHSRHVAQLALSLFDQLQPITGLDAHARALLHYGALLHDIGYRIAAKAHHKHAHRLIAASELPGFEPWELQVMAALARYHRKRPPKPGDEEFIGLSRSRQRLARTLAGMLRMADGMDRTHLSLVRRVTVSASDHELKMTMHAPEGADLELYFATQKADLLEAELGRRIRLRLVTDSAAT